MQQILALQALSTGIAQEGLEGPARGSTFSWHCTHLLAP